MYDIVFISYKEPNADEVYAKLKETYPMAKRVHGVDGIHNAHVAAAKKCFTKMFWVVDGDAVIKDDFKFDYEVSEYDLDCVHVWRCENPINGLVYGYGGVKLLPRSLTLKMNTGTVDMTTSISDKFKPMEQVSNITAFNTDPFNSWKSGFRECVKLASKVIDRQEDDETIKRLDTWCEAGMDKPFGDYCISGARDGRNFGNTHSNEPSTLALINDWNWLNERFSKNSI